MDNPHFFVCHWSTAAYRGDCFVQNVWAVNENFIGMEKKFQKKEKIIRQSIAHGASIWYAKKA